MKRKWKKILGFAAAGALIASVFTGCSSQASGGSTTGESSATLSSKASESGLTVSGNIWGQGVNALDIISAEAQYVNETLGNSYHVYNDNFTADTQKSNIQNMISAQANGIMVFGSVPTLYSTISSSCEKAQIPFVIYDQIPTADKDISMLDANKYYVGCVGTDNYAAGSNMASDMLKAGIHSALILGGAVGDPVHNARVKGFTDTFTKGGGKVLGAARCDSPADAATKGDDLIAANPDAKGIYALTGDFAIGALTALSNHDAKMAVYCSDTTKETIEYIISGAASEGDGGSKISTTLAALLLNNYLAGNAIKDDQGKAPNFSKIVPYVITAENADTYEKYFLQGHPLNEKAIKGLVGKTVTYKDFTDFISNYSLASIEKLN